MSSFLLLFLQVLPGRICAPRAGRQNGEERLQALRMRKYSRVESLSKCFFLIKGDHGELMKILSSPLRLIFLYLYEILH
jgi:hypothetical protein